MRRTGIVGVVSLLLLAVVLTAGASAAEYEPPGLPEAGRCVKVKKGMGEYLGGKCIQVKGIHGGEFNWLPAKEEEHLKFGGAGGTTLLTVTNNPLRSVSCIATNIKGEYTGRHTAHLHFELQGCTNGEGVQCQTGAAKSEINGEFPATLGLVSKRISATGKEIVEAGFDFKPSGVNTVLFAYECGGGVLEETRIEGSLIAQVHPINAMTLKQIIWLQTIKGKQQYTKFVEGEEDVAGASWLNGLETETDTATFGIMKNTYEGENAGKVEIKAQVKE
ncbi:MAG TPA: hypothetical protein VFW29_12270 [Solirubrobacteraceae bacterium]|nr:hypothetical protein [Solirubrobacteraceae bacterium]